jgi:hypothetical protein
MKATDIERHLLFRGRPVFTRKLQVLNLNLMAQN